MGVDCNIIAKLKDGSYEYRSLDRFYVFDSSIKNHNPIQTEEWLYPSYIMVWCRERKQLLESLSTEEADSESIDIEYNIRWLNSVLNFLDSFSYPEEECVGIFNDSYSEIYDEIIIGSKQNDNIKVIAK